MQTSVSLHLYLLFVSYVGLFFLFAYCVSFSVFLIYYNLFYYYSLEACFLMKERKGMDPGGRGGDEKVGGVGGGENIVKI